MKPYVYFVFCLSLFGALLASPRSQAQAVEHRATVEPGSNQTRVQELIFQQSDLVAGSTGNLTVGDAAAAGCSVSNNHVMLNIGLDMGAVYNQGNTAGPATVTVEVKGMNGSSITPLATVPFNNTVSLQVNAGNPSQVRIGDIAADIAGASLTSLRIRIVSANASSPALRLVARLEQAQTIMPVSPETGLIDVNPRTYNTFEQTFTWTPNCKFIRHYQMQLLKLEGAETDVLLTTAAGASRAVLLEKELSPAELLALTQQPISGNSDKVQLVTTMAEGPGRYIWRVRAIGTGANDIANPANWGSWSAIHSFTLNNPTAPGVRPLTDLNWIYSRTFSEGGRVSERISFANGLLHTRQVQTRLLSSQQLLALQTIQDYSGRDALQSLPIPLPAGTGLGFKTSLLSAVSVQANAGGVPSVTTLGAYAPRYFDTNTTYNAPSAAQEFGGYYSGTASSNSLNVGVPSAEYVPFVRTLYTRDGTNRVREQSGAGAILGLRATGTTHTVQTAYGSVTQDELDYMFGLSDAPVAANTYKVVTQDPNGVATVTYQTKAGQTIATAVVGASGGPALLPLTSASDKMSIVDHLDNKSNYNDVGSIASKIIVVPQTGATTKLEFTYKITRQTIVDNLCTEFCSTCDYHVVVTLTNLDEPSVSWNVYDRLYPFSDACSVLGEESAPAIRPIDVPAGTYALTKIVTSYNRATGATATYDNKLSTLLATYTALKSSGVWADNSADVGSFLLAGQANITGSSGLYARLAVLAANPSSGIEQVLLPNGQVGAYKIPFGCDGTPIEIPVLGCPEPATCEASDYSRYLQSNISGTLDFTTSLPGLAGYSDVENMITKMLDPGSPFSFNGECEKLMGCWQSAISSYNAIVKSGAAAPDLLRVFFTCLEIPISDFVTNASGLHAGNVWYTVVFDPNNPTPYSIDCLTQMGYQVNGSSFSPVMSRGDYDGLPACIAAAVANASGTPTAGPAQVQATLDKMQSACQKRCDDRRSEFEAAILRDFARQGIYTYKDKYILVRVDGDDDQINALEGQIRDMRQQLQDVENSLPTSTYPSPNAAAIWVELQGLYEQLAVLSAQVPRTVAIEQQLATLKVKINNKESLLASLGVDVVQLRKFWDTIYKLSQELTHLTPTTHVASNDEYDSYSQGISPQGVPLVSACEIKIMVEELVQECQGKCKLSVTLDQYGRIDPPLTAAQVAQYQSVIMDAVDVRVRPVNEGCSDPYAATPINPSLNLVSVDLTKCSYDVIKYLDRLTREFAARPNYQDPNVYYKIIKCPASNTEGMGEAYEDVLSYVGPLDKECNRVFKNAFDTEKFPDREVHWITAVDGRSTPKDDPNNPFNNQLFNWQLDFRLLWQGYGENHGTEYEPGPPFPFVCGASGLNGEEIPCLVNGQYSQTTGGASSIFPQMDYLLRFINTVTNQPINKDDISSISRPFIDVSAGTGANYNDPFSTDNVFVDITLTRNRGRVRASIELNLQGFGANPADVALFLKWKDVTTCEIRERTYATCYRWVKPVMPAPGPGDYNPVIPTCEEVLGNQLRAIVAQQQDAWIQNKVAAYRQKYAITCAAPASLNDDFTVSYDLGYHHFTLYYYDRAGNLVKTVPPAGFNKDVSNGTATHRLSTTYEYNSLKQLVRQNTADGGTTNFVYNRLGQLRFSFNEKQTSGATTNWRYSYTRYDALGRVVEVGESREGLSTIAWDTDDTKWRAQLQTELQFRTESMDFPAATSGFAQTKTIYNEPAANVSYLGRGTPEAAQRYLTNRVSYTESYNNGLRDPESLVRTYYSYDPHGNVEWLAQDILGLDRRYVRYEYDLLSNKVLKVAYQEGQADQFYHRYAYDDDNRLTAVYTSPNGQLWDQDATYQYYPHGPLKRLELGQDKVQGIDYTYTLQGWLKAINHPDLDPATDPGQDGLTASSVTPGDAFGMALGYFSGDYVRDQSPFSATTSANSMFAPGAASLYNGNIATWQSRNLRNVPADPNATPNPRVDERYTYDQLNRLRYSDQFDPNGNTETPIKDYATSYTYDPNGNIKTLTRRGARPTPTGTAPEIDNLSYTYPLLDPSNPSNSAISKNWLLSVRDQIGSSASVEDIDDQTATVNHQTPSGNYTYDPIGNLSSDAQSGVVVDWTAYGKIAQIRKYTVGHLQQAAYLETTTSYLYDAAGNRVRKTVTPASGGTPVSAAPVVTYYVRDAQGNVLGVYEQRTVDGGESGGVQVQLRLVEQPLYGSQRLGERKPSLLLNGGAAPTGAYTRVLGQKVYELTDHLGNVRAVVTDEKPRSGTGAGARFVPALSAYYNYYPFGMLQPGNYAPGNGTASGGYRFGYNGMEKSDELSSSGLYHAKYWEYDSRISHRWNTDPITKVWQSPYVVFSNSPLWKVDPEGNDDYFNSNGQLIRRDNKGHLIKVQVGKDIKLLSEVNVREGNNLKLVADITAHYAVSVLKYPNTWGAANYGGDAKGDEKASSAFTIGNKSYLSANKSGFTDPDMDNYYNLMSVLRHEKGHQDQIQERGSQKYTHSLHYDVFMGQISDQNTFSRTTLDYKIGMIAHALGYLSESYAAGKENFNKPGFPEKIDYLNETLKVYGISIGMQQGDKSFEIIVRQTETHKGKKTTTYKHGTIPVPEEKSPR